MLSFFRPETNFEAMFFAASKRSGWKSRANIDELMSRAIIISVPSVVEVRQLSLVCGRASTMIRHPIANIRITNIACRRYSL